MTTDSVSLFFLKKGGGNILFCIQTLQLWVQACQLYLNKLFSLYQGLLNWLWLHCCKITVIFPLTHTNPQQAGEQRNIRGMKAVGTGREVRAFLNGSEFVPTHQLLRLAEASLGCHWGLPLGSLGVWTSVGILLPSLPNSIVSSASSGPGKVGAGFPSFLRHVFLFLYLSGAKDLNLYLELNSEMLTAFQNPRLSEHRGLSFTPRKRPAGKGGKLVPLAIGTQRNPKSCDLTFWHVQHHPHWSQGERCAGRFLFSGELCEAGIYIYTAASASCFKARKKLRASRHLFFIHGRRVRVWNYPAHKRCYAFKEDPKVWMLIIQQINMEARAFLFWFFAKLKYREIKPLSGLWLSMRGTGLGAEVDSGFDLLAPQRSLLRLRWCHQSSTLQHCLGTAQYVHYLLYLCGAVLSNHAPVFRK